MKIIESPQNQTFKILKSLSGSKGIKKEQKFLVCGQHLLNEVKDSGLAFESIHFDESITPDYLLSKKLFNELSPVKTDLPLFIVNTQVHKKADLNTPPKGVEVLLPVGDPKNLGALVRTCLAFSVEKIILLEEAANPYLPECVKSSAGAVLKAPFYTGPSIKDLKKDHSLYSLDKDGVSITNSNLKGKPLRLLLGEEGGHIPKNLSENFLSIPISKDVESLNVNSCLSIALFSLTDLK